MDKSFIFRMQERKAFFVPITKCKLLLYLFSFILSNLQHAHFGEKYWPVKCPGLLSSLITRYSVNVLILRSPDQLDTQSKKNILKR